MDSARSKVLNKVKPKFLLMLRRDVDFPHLSLTYEVPMKG